MLETVAPLRPRLFFPYFDEAKAVLQEQLVDLQEDLEVVRLRMLRCCMSHHFPDTLYMVSPMMGNPDATQSMDSNTLNRMDSCEPGKIKGLKREEEEIEREKEKKKDPHMV